MNFCPKCQSRMKPRQIKTESKVIIALVCPRCGYSEGISGEKGEKLTDNSMQASPSIKVVGEEADFIKTMPTTTIECPKCHNMEAQVVVPTNKEYRCHEGYPDARSVVIRGDSMPKGVIQERFSLFWISLSKSSKPEFFGFSDYSFYTTEELKLCMKESPIFPIC